MALTSSGSNCLELIDAITRHRDQTIVVYDAANVTTARYSELLEMILAFGQGMRRPMHEGTPVFWCCTTTLESLAWDIACLASDYVSAPVPHEEWTSFRSGKADAGSLGRNQPDHFFGEPIDTTGGPISTVKMSSGSSGRPKLVPARRSHVGHTLRQSEAMFRMDQSDVALVCLPLAVFLQRIIAYMALRAGAQLHLASPLRSLTAARRAAPTCTAVVPGVLDSWRVAANARLQTLGALLGGRLRWVWCGSAPIAPAALEALEQQGVPIYQGYGMSEVGFIAKNHPGHNRRGSVGPLFPGVTLRFGDSGEIQVRTPYLPHEHYLGPGDRPLVRQGWVHTGDRGHLDADGFLYVAGRTDDCVVAVNGHKASFADLESWAAAIEGIDAAQLTQSESDGQVLLLWTQMSADTWLRKLRASSIWPYVGGTLKAWALIDGPPPSVESRYFSPSGKLLRRALLGLYLASPRRGRFDVVAPQ